jgi:hypothetical protein
MREIRDVLDEAYQLVVDFPFSSLSAESLRDAPSNYIKGMRNGKWLPRAPYGPTNPVTRRLNWGAWELARATLDEASKNLMLTTLGYRSVTPGAWRDEVRTHTPAWDLTYAAANLVSDAYYSHFKAVMGGLYIAGVMPNSGIILYRDTEAQNTWTPDQGRWSPPSGRAFLGQSKILNEYDVTQNRRCQWLPTRDDVLQDLKKHREHFTYEAHRIGSYQTRTALDLYKTSFPVQFTFLSDLIDVFEGITPENPRGNAYLSKFNAMARLTPLKQRLGELGTWARGNGLLPPAGPEAAPMPEPQ